MNKTETLETALELVNGSRHEAYGDACACHTAIAAVWNGILAAAGKLVVPLNAHDVACLLEGMKIARRYCGSYREDNYVDAAGYAAIAAECATELNISKLKEECARLGSEISKHVREQIS